MGKITDFLNDKWGALRGKPKLKFRVEFNNEVNRKGVEEALHGFKIVKAEQKGVFSWRVDIRTNKDSEDVITNVSKRRIIRSIELVSD